MKTLKTIFTLLIGVGAGLAAGYLTAPNSGKKTRKKLASEAETYRKILEEKANQSLEEARTVLNETLAPTNKTENKT